MGAKERAVARADRHKIAEAQLHQGLNVTYGYSRIYNAEVASYEQGDSDRRNIDINRAWKWINDKVELSYTDYDSFLRTMMED